MKDYISYKGAFAVFICRCHISVFYLQALITLFVFSTRDGWVEIMHNGIDAVGIDKQVQKFFFFH